MNTASDSATKLDLIVLEQHLDDRLEKIDEKNKGYRDQILTGLDKVVKELETLREDNIIGTHQIEEIREEVADNTKELRSLNLLRTKRHFNLSFHTQLPSAHNSHTKQD